MTDPVAAENEPTFAYRVPSDLYAPEAGEWSILVRGEQIAVGDILENLATAHTRDGEVIIDGSPDKWEVLEI
jgi:hypothetical protein